MGFVKRIRDITMATLNDRLEKAEDPVKLIDQFLWSTRDEIIQAERLHHQYLNHSHQLKSQWLQAEQQIERKEYQAMVALKAGEEMIARSALSEKTMLVENANSYRGLYEQSSGSLIELEEQLRELRQEYQLVYDKRAYYVSRMESLRLQQRMNERMSFNNNNNPAQVMRKMDSRLSEMENESQSLREVRKNNGGIYGDPTVASRQSLAVDREMEQLKKKLNGEGWSL
ncbi:PspA/IM30 family protein [Paenibacillus endoradicis]|uniref:PspA/IM30 family protein n=1 Tax=Paenibacillus endoradicis TaxID=2972487 RepID=UPI002158CEAF|nr:PspA/IM30 family protein [Paenibacillus endoradicis]MCR8657772.1 PspA/IM30 family protein [Paenibacillus endoradicis]